MQEVIARIRNRLLDGVENESKVAKKSCIKIFDKKTEHNKIKLYIDIFL